MSSQESQPGFGPSSSKMYSVVEHAAIVKNVDKGLQTLGGMEKISAAMCEGAQLELKLQPDNPYHSGIIAEKKNMMEGISGQMNLVFRVRRNKKKNICETECKGMIKEAYQFKSMADFQYLPIVPMGMPKNKGDPIVYKDLVPELIPTDIPSSFNWFTKKPADGGSVPRFLTPYMYSRYSSGTSSKIFTHEVERGDISKISHGQNLRCERKSQTITVQHQDTFPDAPTEEAVKDVDARVKNAETRNIVQQLFDERPMWNRVAIAARTGLDDNILKLVLAKYAFYILSGPWGRLWCRFGYDPRKDPAARQYQTIMVSFRKHQKIPERAKRLKVCVADGKSGRQSDVNYIYTPGLLPAVRQMWYCVCDIHLPAAQKVAKADYLGTLNKVDAITGWLPADTVKAIRNGIKDDVRRTSKQLEESDPDFAEDGGSDSDLSDREMDDETIGEPEDWMD